MVFLILRWRDLCNTTNCDSLKLDSRGHLILSPSSKDDHTTLGKDIDPKFALAEKDRKTSFQGGKKKKNHSIQIQDGSISQAGSQQSNGES